jgi:alkanesulfonate monooxygenase SsuD/methylene tetrahydromethanopterin reductase-like flavin-dependent oxidoreductase (luciferase family)
LVTYAYLAGITKKLELVTGVIILPQRQTALFAKQAADVDLFSEGRLRLGVGIGWNWVEYDGLEMPRHFRRRGKRQEQQIALIRKLWEEPVVDYEDSDHRIDRAGILPRPKRQIPIWLGGSSEAAFDRAARIGAGFLFGARAQTEAVQTKRGSRRGCANSAGMSTPSASNRSSNTVAVTTNGPATSTHGATLGGVTYLS